MFSEIMYTSNTAHRRLFIYMPHEDRVAGMDSPFDPGVGVVDEDLETLFASIESFSARLSGH